MPVQGIAHKDLTDPQLHELKGASTALAGQLPVADGNGNTSFQTLTIESLEYEPEQVASQTSTTINTPAALIISALSATTTGILADASSFVGVNKNTKENAVKINEIIQQFNALKLEHKDVLNKLNEVIAALEALGLFAQENS